MKKFITILMAIVLVLALLGGCGGNDPAPAPGGNGEPPAPPEEVFVFRMASIGAPGEVGGVALYWLADTLNERSGGRIQATHFGGRALASSDPELGELVRQNSVQMVPIPTHTLAAMANIPQYSVFEFPYLFTDWNEIYRLLDSDLARGWAQALQDEAGVTVYGGIVKGWLSIGTTAGPVDNLAVFNGQRIRTMATDMQMSLVSSFGGSPTIVAFGEIYTAMQQGTIDGILTATGLFESERFGEVINHLTITRATAHFHIPTVNTAWLNSLPPDLRAIFDEAMNDFLVFQRALELENDQRVMDLMYEEFGVEVRQFTDAELAPFRAAVRPMWEANFDLPGPGVLDAVLDYLGKDFESIFN